MWNTISLIWQFIADIITALSKSSQVIDDLVTTASNHTSVMRFESETELTIAMHEAQTKREELLQEAGIDLSEPTTEPTTAKPTTDLDLT